jgi:biopolymer transport protein ExbB
MSTFPSSLLAQGAGTAGATGASPSPDGLASTVWDLAIKGGPVMIPIAICSLVALALVVERLLSLRRVKVMPPEFVAGIRPALSRGQAAALEFCRSHDSPSARVLEAGIRRWDSSAEQVEKRITEAGLRETTLLRKNFRGLVVISAVSPLLGLLGTIFGMITAFRTVAASADALGKTELLASGIYEAMVTTAAGLIVAIPTLLIYHALAAKVDRLVFDMDAACIDLVEAHADSCAAGRTIADERVAGTPQAVMARHESATAQPASTTPIATGQAGASRGPDPSIVESNEPAAAPTAAQSSRLIALVPHRG